MGKEPSIETQLRHALRDMRAFKREADTYAETLKRVRRTLDAVSADRDEWKRRFDILLSRDGGDRG